MNNSNNNLTQKDKISKLLVELFFKEDKSAKEFQILSKVFNAYNNMGKKDAPYPEITRYVLFEYKESNFDSLLDEYINNNNNMNVDKKNWNNFVQSFEKHYKLALIQKEFILQNSKDAQEYANKIKNEITSFEKIKGTIYTEFIAILGIFSALIFGLFGGFQGLSQAIVSISDSWSIGRVLIISSGIMTCLTLLIFGLLQWVARITNRKLISCDCHVNKKKCEHSLFQRHRTLFSLLFSFIFIFVLGEYIESVENLMGINDFARKYEYWLTFITFSIPILLMVIFSIALIFIFKKNHSPSENEIY
ncbi:hypothetical protein IGK74_000413 [Enterococcus sp. AZ150]|uniref:hypothetical protein n=1 Tax=Enterococcus sp. AZ150 TaxID=2774866 RepID=UPI003F26C30A